MISVAERQEGKETGRFILQEQHKNACGNRTPRQIIDGGDQQLEIGISFDKSVPELMVNVTMVADGETGRAELWVNGERVWIEPVTEYA